MTFLLVGPAWLLGIRVPASWASLTAGLADELAMPAAASAACNSVDVLVSGRLDDANDAHGGEVRAGRTRGRERSP